MDYLQYIHVYYFFKEKYNEITGIFLSPITQKRDIVHKLDQWTFQNSGLRKYFIVIYDEANKHDTECAIYDYLQFDFEKRRI